MHYVAHLSKDKKLKPILETHDVLKLKSHKNICLRLCASIMSQQLSTKVADVIFARFINLFDEEEPTPIQILKVKPEVLRSIGLSNAKVSYVHNVARFAVERGLDSKKLNKMSNEQVLEYLTEIKGVGRWTAEMILMFTLGREDIFSADDLIIQNSIEAIYKFDKTDKKLFKEKMLQVSSKWEPYRTYACLHLWRWNDTQKKLKK